MFITAVCVLFLIKLRWPKTKSLKRIYSFRPGEVLPYMGYIGMCGPKGYGFSAVLVITRVSIFAILVSNRVWFFHSSLELGMSFRRSYFFIIIDKTIIESPSRPRLLLDSK